MILNFKKNLPNHNDQYQFHNYFLMMISIICQNDARHKKTNTMNVNLDYK